MSAITMTSDQARIKWRDTVDTAFQGGEVVIERYGKPMVAVVNYDHWSRMANELARLRRIIEADRQFAEMDAGNVVEFDISQAPA
jgi:DNA-binding transcriptional regulator/RsmH inhibitor MraZ